MTTLSNKLRLIAEDQSRRDHCETLDEAATEIENLRSSLSELHNYLRFHGSVADTHDMLIRSHVALGLPTPQGFKEATSHILAVRS